MKAAWPHRGFFLLACTSSGACAPEPVDLLDVESSVRSERLSQFNTLILDFSYLLAENGINSAKITTAEVTIIDLTGNSISRYKNLEGRAKSGHIGPKMRLNLLARKDPLLLESAYFGIIWELTYWPYGVSHVPQVSSGKVLYTSGCVSDTQLGRPAIEVSCTDAEFVGKCVRFNIPND